MYFQETSLGLNSQCSITRLVKVPNFNYFVKIFKEKRCLFVHGLGQPCDSDLLTKQVAVSTCYIESVICIAHISRSWHIGGKTTTNKPGIWPYPCNKLLCTH